MNEQETGSVRAVARGLEDAGTGPGAGPTPGAAQRALEVFIGRWINEGVTAARPGLDPERIVTSDVYEWAPGGFFVVHSAYGRIGGIDVGGVEIIGYDPGSNSYTSRFFDSFGNEGVSRLTVSGRVWTWQGERTRCDATISEDGRIQRALHERSDDRRTWQPSMDVTLVKVG